MYERANGVRYPLVGGTRGRRFIGTNFKPPKMPENAQTPTSRVHALLGGSCVGIVTFTRRTQPTNAEYHQSVLESGHVLLHNACVPCMRQCP